MDIVVPLGELWTYPFLVPDLKGVPPKVDLKKEPSREFPYPTFGKGKIIVFKLDLGCGNMLRSARNFKQKWFPKTIFLHPVFPSTLTLFGAKVLQVHLLYKVSQLLPKCLRQTLAHQGFPKKLHQGKKDQLATYEVSWRWKLCFQH